MPSLTRSQLTSPSAISSMASVSGLVEVIEAIWGADIVNRAWSRTPWSMSLIWRARLAATMHSVYLESTLDRRTAISGLMTMRDLTSSLLFGDRADVADEIAGRSRHIVV